MHRCRTLDAAVLYSSRDYSERLGIPGDAPGFGPIRGEFPSINLGEILGRPILRAGPSSVSMASVSSAPCPLSREITNASFEGSSSMGSTPAGFEGAPEGPS
jgi:hypothetical protein